MFRIIFCFFATILFANLSISQQKITQEEYINQWKNTAISNMKKYKIPASITLAQGILESGNGNSMLAVKANNHFGIKCHSDWTGKKIYHDDDKKGECFRHYNNAAESFEDHSIFLQKSRYAFLFELKITDYKGWAKGLKKAGYATNPKYPDLLIGIIERNQLYKFDDLNSQEIEENHVNESINNPIPIDTATEITISNSYPIFIHENRIKYIKVDKTYSFNSIEQKLSIRKWQLLKYNDLSESYELHEGDILFIQPKRNKNNIGFHNVKKGDNLWRISQKYGVKLKKILKYNHLNINDNIAIGQKILLKKP